MGLYSKIFDIENIRNSIKDILNNDGSKTAGPDGINKYNIACEEVVIKEIKLRLRGYKKANSRIVKIPKKDGSFRNITICNLYDRMAQQCVYKVINTRLEMNMDSQSFGFRKGISAKIPVSRVCDVALHSKEFYTVEIDFNKCFDNIPLEKALDMLRELGIGDGKVIQVVKRLMYISKEYKGIGLGQGTILGPLLANCYLHKLDLWAREFLNYKHDPHVRRNIARHKGKYVKWLYSLNKKVHGMYYRYADDTIIICLTKEEQIEIANKLREFVENNLEISINESKSELNRNKCKFLGFNIRKTQESISITIKDESKYLEELRKFKFDTFDEIWHFLKWINGVLIYFDIANNVDNFLSAVALRLLHRSIKHGSRLKKVKGKTIYKFKGENGREVEIDIYRMRKNLKVSYKDYLKDNKWLSLRDFFKVREEDSRSRYYRIYVWELWTKQKGKDYLTGKPLDTRNCHVHHKIPNKIKISNEFDNLILIDKETHRLIHNEEETDNPKIIRYRKHLVDQ